MLVKGLHKGCEQLVVLASHKVRRVSDQPHQEGRKWEPGPNLRYVGLNHFPGMRIDDLRLVHKIFFRDLSIAYCIRSPNWQPAHEVSTASCSNMSIHCILLNIQAGLQP